jgi:hypothetical protein
MLTLQEEFIRVIEALDDPDEAVRDHALFHISHATEDQLEAALRRLERLKANSPHVAGLRALVETKSISPTAIEEMIEGENEVERKYGLAIGVRRYTTYPDLLELAAKSKDSLIESLTSHMLKQHQLRKRARKD